MWYRIRQFYAALTARVSEADRKFAAEWLTLPEQELFSGMSLADQQHALAVARTAARISEKLPVDRARLIRAALLHDVGRRQGELGPVGKAVMVLLAKDAPGFARRLAAGRVRQPRFLRQWSSAYFDHPDRGAALLSAAGTPDAVVELVRKHHKAPAGDDPPELAILRRADNAN